MAVFVFYVIELTFVRSYFCIQSFVSSSSCYIHV